MEAFGLARDTFRRGGKLLVCGNGGSAADSEHIVGELMKGFLLRREISEDQRSALVSAYPDSGEYLAEGLQGALPAISLVSHSALIHAYANDVAADMVFAQQVWGYGQEEDTLLGITTSGNSANVVNAVKVARVMGLHTIGLTGKDGGRLAELCDVMICAPAIATQVVQEYHLPIYHALCAMLEMEFFAE